MKIKIKKDLLLENLNKVSKAISTKNLVPALAGIKFDLTKEGLTLTASDNDITIRSFIKNDDNIKMIFWLWKVVLLIGLITLLLEIIRIF